ncbi:MAG: hypothetical protein WBD41_14185 [Rhodococcus sp. (in: high G+C Gram-positive bacteria)]
MSDQAIFEKKSTANYRGDRRTAIGQVFGPNTLREFFVAVEADYDEGAGRTKLTFDLTPTDWRTFDPSIVKAALA